MKQLVTTVLVLGIAIAARAGEDHDHGHSHADITVPATLSEVRTGIADQQKKLTETLAAKDAAAAHAATDVLAAYVKAIPALVQDVDEAAKLRITGMANNAAKAWAEAAHHADNGDYKGAVREATKADGAYRLLEARLPKD